jgi:hypothetical protein
MKTFKETLIEMYSKDYDRWKDFAMKNSSFEAWQRAKEYQVMLERTKELPDNISSRDYAEFKKNPRT